MYSHIRDRRSQRVYSSALTDRLVIRRRMLEVDYADVNLVGMEQTSRHISRSYGQLDIPIGPFAYILVDTSPQFEHPHVTARGTDLFKDMISSTVSPHNSPAVP